MKIGNLALANDLVLAPMAGITQLPLRRLAKEQGCALVVSEMISAHGLVHGGHKTLELLRSHPSEKPLSVQLFGARPEILKEAASIVETHGAHVLDINLGCSVRKVIKQGAGAALMGDPDRLQVILKAVRGAITIPLTVKLRAGWDPSGNQAVRAARIAQDCGVDAVTLHPRTAQQGFAGRADWSLIARLKDCLAIPVIGNGDVRTADHVLRMVHETACAGVMIGRAAMGNPWIFRQALDVKAGRPARPVSLRERREVTLRYIGYFVDHFGEARAVRMLRSRLPWFVKGLPRCGAFRNGIVRIESGREMMESVRTYFHELEISTANGLWA
jgi:nifR3 family TIM-barrel protein